jgi:CheY-like chemotaxis protein
MECLLNTRDEGLSEGSAHEGSARQRSLKGLRILVVDDDPDSRDGVAAFLSRAGAEVRTAAGGVEALRVLALWWPTAIVSDLAMNAGDGFYLIESVRALRAGRSLPAVVVSGAGGAAVWQRARAAGFDARLTKPVDADELIAVLSDLVSRPRRRDT